MTAPLAGVRVIEATSWMAAPSAGALMADMGADVVKVEPLKGDAVRGMIRPPRIPEGFPQIDYSFTVDNRGKRSIAVALDKPDGAELMKRLIVDADVFLCNLLPHRQARFGLDPESLLALNPKLVHATLTGYGVGGPDEQRPGFDVTAFFGRGAVTDTMTEPGGIAPNPASAQGDHATGLALTVSILAALRLVEQTGEGQVVGASLLGTAAWTMATDLSAPLIDGRQPSKRDRHHRIVPLANRFRCSDDRWIIFNMPEEHWWPRFCEAVGLDHLLNDDRFDTVRTRFQNMPFLIDLIDDVFATKTMAEWAPIFDDAGLIWGPAATLVELTNDPQAEAIGLFPEIDHPDGAFRTVAVPLSIAGADIGPRGPAPEVGAQTRQVLEEVGFSGAEIEGMAAAGIVGLPSDSDSS